MKTDMKTALAELQKSEGGDELVRLLTEFSGVKSVDTVRRWTKDDQQPVGLNLVKTRIFLEMIGYELSDHLKMKPAIQELAEGITLGLITLETACEEIGCPRDTLIGLLRGGSNTTNKRMKLIAAINQRLHTQLVESKNLWHQRLRISAPQKSEVEQRSKANGQHHEEKKISCSSHENAIRGAAALAQSLLPLAELIRSDEFTPEERTHLRDVAGKFTIFNLSNVLVGLCSERSRNNQEI